MDAPPIQYARTEDGVNIAYWTSGDVLRTDTSQPDELATGTKIGGRSLRGHEVTSVSGATDQRSNCAATRARV